MSDVLWRKCQHCGKERYCSAALLRDHEEDCDQRPSLRQRKAPTCPKCGSRLGPVKPNAWICLSEPCDFEIGVIQGGKPS